MQKLFTKKHKDILLFILSLLFLFIYYYLKPKDIKIKSKYYSEMAAAAKKMDSLQKEVLSEKIKRGFKIDKNIDKNTTGLIGLEWSGITTTLGNLESKRTSANPDFAALLVKVFREAGLKKGDTVAANFSSSFPALNLAFIAAADVMELKTIIVTSVGSSMYGANIEDFTYLDMENDLYAKNLIKNKTVAYSLGGSGDVGKEFEKDIVEKITHRLNGYELIFFYEENFEKNLEKRYEFYKTSAKGSIKAFINIGKNLLAVGETGDTIDNHKIVVPKSAANKTGLVGNFLKEDVVVFYVLNIKSIAFYYNLAFDPDTFSEIGTAPIYYISPKNFWNYVLIGMFTLFIVIHVVFFKCKKNKFIAV